MCQLCLEFQKNQMTIKEARVALLEMTKGKNMSHKDYWHWVELEEAKNLEELLKKYKGN